MILTPSEVLDADCTALADRVGEACVIHYHPTADEVDAIEFIGARYAVSSVLLSGMELQEDDTYRMTICPLDVSEALAADGIDRVPMLSEDTALARLVWLIGPAAE
tara:strand:+ start:259 stop:576 length:318 start_codon:yes stop_codon:yes gene_type:complete